MICRGKKELIRFLNGFYNHLLQNTNISEQKGKTKNIKYKEEVFEILHNAKARLPLSEKELVDIQSGIEDLTMSFDEESMFKSVPNIIRTLIKEHKESAKDYLRGRVPERNDMELLSEFGQYTIEALIVHVLGMVFNTLEYNSIIRVATLVEQLEYNVRIQATLLRCRRCKTRFSTAADDAFQARVTGDARKRSKLEMMYPFGSGLVQFMEERELITLICDSGGEVKVKKKKGSYFLPLRSLQL